jgi:hypothetical protein
MRHGAFAWCAAVLFIAAQQGAAQSNLPVPKREEETQTRELDVPLPEYPLPGSLVRFPTNWTTNAIFVDHKTLSVAGDGVVRFAMVVRSSSGAETVSFEGIRCVTGERRVYAYGRRTADGGTWSAALGSTWRQINDSRINRHYYEFWRDVFCDGSMPDGRREILKNIESGGRERVRGLPD